MRKCIFLVLTLLMAAVAVQPSPTPYTFVYADAAAWNRTTTQWTCGTSRAVSRSYCVVSNFGLRTENSSKGDQWYAYSNTAYAEGHAWVDNPGLHGYSQINLAA
jgi:hypothetical protein